MASRSDGRHRFPQSQRRRTGWEEGTGGTTLLNLTTTTPSFVGQALGIQTDGLTLVRTRGYFKIVMQLAASLGDGMTGAFGIGLASTAAVAAGIGSVPTPITEQNWEGWLYWHGFSVEAITASESNWGNEVLDVAEIDSKAMRKIDSDMSFYAAIEIGTETGAVTAIVHHDSRMLFKLP